MKMISGSFKKQTFKRWLLVVSCLMLLTSYGCATHSGSAPVIQPVKGPISHISGKHPNIIIIYTDDLGYGDLSCFGSKAIKTPNIDKMAKEGMRFTDYYSCNALCSPSRVGLLTGRYPQRAGVNHVFFEDKWTLRLGRLLAVIGAADLSGAKNEVDGLPEDEITIAEALKTAGYRTAIFGKWHLGNITKNQKYNPLNHGFDYYFGVMDHRSSIYRNKEMIKEKLDREDQGKLTGLYTQEIIRFMEESKAEKKPFFCYLAHTYPHRPHYSSKNFHGKSRGGPYGDCVEELDWSTGEILTYLKLNNLDDNTLVIFTSDNGPWNRGSPGLLRGRKGQIYEGGFRVPMIAWWPGRIQPGSVNSEPVINLDLFNTCLDLAGVKIPQDRIIDGRDITNLLFGKDDKSPNEALYFFHHDSLEGIRVGKWKLLRNINTYTYPAPINTIIRKKIGKGPYLYDMEVDPGESYDIGDNYPEMVEKLSKMMDQFEEQMDKDPKGLL